MITNQSERREIIEACKLIQETGLNQGTSGNVSIRISQNEFLVTPSGVPYENMTLDKVVPVKISPAQYRGNYRPTLEWKLHLAVYRTFPWNEAGSVVHTQSHFSTTVACMRRCIPAFNYMVMVGGSYEIPCAEYAIFGSTQLSDNILRVLKNGCRACLMANHGLLVYAQTLEKALYITAEIENLAKQYLHLLSSGQPFTILDDKEMSRVLELAWSYGKLDENYEGYSKSVSFPPRVEEVLDDAANISQTEWKSEEFIKLDADLNLACSLRLESKDSADTVVGEAKEVIAPLETTCASGGSMVQITDVDNLLDDIQKSDVFQRRFEV